MKQISIGGKNCYIHDGGARDVLLVQPVDDHDLDGLENEIACIENEAPGKGFTLAAFKVDDWNRDLSPWEAPPVFGDAAFGCGAAETLKYVTQSVIPELTGIAEIDRAGKGRARTYEVQAGKAVAGDACRFIIGGYSLAGLFALWAAYQTDLFEGVAAASPSMWFPGFIDYMKASEIRASEVYLSLGDKEEKTRNPVMATVGERIREARDILEERNVPVTLEWNPGNHFRDPDIRTARAFTCTLNGQGSL